MATNITINDRLIEDARRAGGHRTKKEAVTTALEEYIRRHRQRRILEAFGTFDFAHPMTTEPSAARSEWDDPN